MESMTLSELKKTIFADGAIDRGDVRLLNEAIFDDEGINKTKADFLFEIKDSIVKKKQIAEFEELFIEAITTFLLDDDDSPGEIDDNEGKWLRAKIQLKGYADRIDKKLLANLRKKAINFPDVLNYKHKTVKAFETLLFGLRFVTFLAVIGSMFASIALFVRSSMKVYDGLVVFVGGHLPDAHSAHDGVELEPLQILVRAFIQAVDGYLFAMVLIIFSMGIYELFINKMDPVNKKTDSRPGWLQIDSIDDLKSSLGKVILMIMIVQFFEHTLSLKYSGITELLLLGVGILLISAALYLTHIGGKHGHKPTHE
jgi:uncharacterized membrane protein YqhA